jgi:hypothetical protein
MPDKRLVDPLTGRLEPVVVPQRPFTEVLNDLRRDAEELPQRGPVKVSEMGLRRLGRNQIVVQSADAEATFAIRCSMATPMLAWRPRT